MSSVRNRILQFQQTNSQSIDADARPTPHQQSRGSITSTGLKSSFARSSSNGSVPPDIVATTVPSIGRNQFVLSNSNNNNNTSSCNNNNTSSCNNNNTSSSIVSGRNTKNSNICSTFPYTTGLKQPLAQSNEPSGGNTANSYFGNSYGLKTTSGVTNHNQLNRKFSAGYTESSSPLSSTWTSGLSTANNSGKGTYSPEKRSSIPDIGSSGGTLRSGTIPLKSSATQAGNNKNESFNLTPPLVNRANKPTTLAMKKASMTINLSSNTSTSSSPSPTGISNGNGINNTNGNSNCNLPSPTRPKARTPTTKTNSNPLSSIPKFNSVGNGSSGTALGNSVNSTTVGTVRYREHTPGGIGRRSPATSNRVTPVTTPTGVPNGVAFGSSLNSSSTGRFYHSIGWKEKFEESEKKRTHLVNLAQKATRDYEELRRRYHDLYTDHEKVVGRCDNANSQLESLRKASEATYEEYYKLKRRYEAENKEKSAALNRVDEYNKENRRLKRQSALMMQQIDPTTLLANGELFDSVKEAESPESDKEIQYLRKQVKELECKIIELESELERIRLSEFESQESVLLMNDSIQSGKNENHQLKDQLRKLDEENRKLARSLEDLTFEHDSLKCKQNVDEEKLVVAETELKKLLNEKSILQRQSVVFMNNEEMDNRLLDALAQIGDLQTSMEEQKNALESQIIELKNRLSEKELEEETNEIHHSATIKTLEEEIRLLRTRAEEAERNFQDCSNPCVAPPPPPPPPMGLAPPPPPPPPPMINVNLTPTTSLGSSLQAAMGTLRKGNRNNLETDTPPNGLCDGQSKSLVSGSPQIDDIISQLKQGIKLRPTDKTLSRKQTENQEKPTNSNAVEEMRSILDNMRRTRTVEKRF